MYIKVLFRKQCVTEMYSLLAIPRYFAAKYEKV